MPWRSALKENVSIASSPTRTYLSREREQNRTVTERVGGKTRRPRSSPACARSGKLESVPCRRGHKTKTHTFANLAARYKRGRSASTYGGGLRRCGATGHLPIEPCVRTETRCHAKGHPRNEAAEAHLHACDESAPRPTRCKTRRPCTLVVP